MQTTCYAAHVTLRDGIPRRLTFRARNLEQARRLARVHVTARFPGQPLSFAVRPA